MAEILNTETVAELTEKDLGPQSWLLHSDNLGDAFKESYLSFLVKLNAIYGTKQEVFDINQVLPTLAKQVYVDDKNKQIYDLISQISKGSLNVFPTDIPTAKIDTYIAMIAGTYVNFGGLVVSTDEINSGIVQLLRSKNGTWSKKFLLVPELPNVKPTPSNDLTMGLLSADDSKILNIYDVNTSSPFNTIKTSNLNDGTPIVDDYTDNSFLFKVPDAIGGGYAQREQSNGIIVKSFPGVVGNGTVDCTNAINDMVYKCSKRTKKINPVNETAVLTWESGVYLISGPITFPSNFKINPIGLVFIKCVGYNAGVRFANNQENTPEFYKEGYNGGKIINNEKGCLIIYHVAAIPDLNNPSSINRANIIPGTTGLRLGNTIPNGRMLCRYTASGYRIWGFDNALELLPIDHFIGNHYDVHLEGCNNLIVFPDGYTKTNSGENFSFYRPVLAGATNAIVHEIPAMDINLYGGSYDYIDNLVKFSKNCNGFSTTKFIGGYSERINKKWITETSTVTGNKRKPRVFMSGMKFLTGKDQIFEATNMGFELTVTDSEWTIDNARSSWDVLTPSSATLRGDNPLIDIVKFEMKVNGDKGFILRDLTNVIYPKFNFSNKTPEVLTDSNKYFSVSDKANISGIAIVSDTLLGDTVLDVGTSGVAGITIKSKDMYSVNFGDVFNFGMIYKSNTGSDGRNYLDPRFWLEYYDELGDLIGTSSYIQQRDDYSNYLNTYKVTSWGQQAIILDINVKMVKFVLRLQSFSATISIQKIIIDKESI